MKEYMAKNKQTNKTINAGDSSSEEYSDSDDNDNK